MASKAERLRKAYEFKLGADLAAKLTDSQIKILSAYYNSLSETEQSDIDNKIAKGASNDLTDMAKAMAEENAEGPPESEMEPDAPSSSVTLYEGTKETDLVDEEIDETILRALGLEDVFDIDYGTYKTLIKEKMMADRMGQKMDSGEAAAVTEEFKRIKSKVGRFRIKKKKINTGNITSPMRNRNQKSGGGSSGMKNFLALKGDSPAQTESTENFAKSNSILDEILATIKNLFNFERDTEKRRQQEEARRNKQSRENKLESGSNIGKVLSNIGKAILKPLQGPLDYILNFIKYTFLAKVVGGLLEWFADPANQGKVQAIGRFLKDWWPALVAAYLLFGNGLSRGILKLGAILVKGTAKLLKVALPALMNLIKRNPKAAAAVALFTAGATIPMLFPETVDEQERNTEKQAEKRGEKDVRAELERKANSPNFYERLTGQDSEAKEQLYKLDTGNVKSYNKGGKVESASPNQSKLGLKNFLPFLAPLLGPAAPMLLPFMMGDKMKGIGDKIKENPLMLAALGPMAFPIMMMSQDKKKSTASNAKKDPALDITVNSGTDVKGAGVDTQLVPARPGDIVMNKEAVDAVGPKTFDTIATNSGARITGAGPDTQMIAARPGEIIINRETVNRVGPGFFLGLNKQYGGSNANKPKMAKVQAASGGGFVLPTFQGGGMVGGLDLPTFQGGGMVGGALDLNLPPYVETPISSFNEKEETPNIREPDKGEKKKAYGGGATTSGGNIAPLKLLPAGLPAEVSRQTRLFFGSQGSNGQSGSLGNNISKPTSSSPLNFSARFFPRSPSSNDGLESLTINQLTTMLDPTISGASNRKVFAAARNAREEGKAAGLSGEQLEKNVLIATIRATRAPQNGTQSTTGLVRENSGINVPGGGADRQHIHAQPGEYVLPVDTVMRLGGPSAVDGIVARTDSNSTPAKMLPASSKKPVPGPPVPEGTAGLVTLPPITGGSSGGGVAAGGRARNVPTFSATSPYVGDRNNNADIYGIQ